MTYTPRKIGIAIRTMAARRNMRTTDVGMHAGINYRTMSEIVNGTRLRTSLKELSAIAGAMQTDLVTLIVNIK